MKFLHNSVRQGGTHHACLYNILLQLIWRQNHALSVWSVSEYRSLHYWEQSTDVVTIIFSASRSASTRNTCCSMASEKLCNVITSNREKSSRYNNLRTAVDSWYCLQCSGSVFCHLVQCCYLMVAAEFWLRRKLGRVNSDVLTCQGVCGWKQETAVYERDHVWRDKRDYREHKDAGCYIFLHYKVTRPSTGAQVICYKLVCIRIKSCLIIQHQYSWLLTVSISQRIDYIAVFHVNQKWRFIAVARWRRIICID
jgi:hypothetical protein